MEGVMLLKTKLMLAQAWTSALRKSYSQCSLFLAALKKQTFHLLWLLFQSPLYWAKDIFQAYKFRFFPIGFWFYPESHMRERGMSQSPAMHRNVFPAVTPGVPHLPLPPSIIRPAGAGHCLVGWIHWLWRHREVALLHTAGCQPGRFSHSPGSPVVLSPCTQALFGLPCLLLRFHVTSKRNHNPNTKGYAEIWRNWAKLIHVTLLFLCLPLSEGLDSSY